VIISLILLPAEGKHEAIYESIKATVMVGVALGFAIAYLSRQPGTSLGEGAVVGLVWAGITVVLDLALFAVGAFNDSGMTLRGYFIDVASSYAVIPIVTTLTMGYLTRAQAGTRSDSLQADQTPGTSG
jgi:hypothetical protein